MPRKKKRPLYVMDPSEPPERYRSDRHTLVDVTMLPVETPDENKTAIQAWLHGMAEGTIPASQERRKTLELSARLDGLIVTKSTSVEVKAKMDKQTIEDILSLTPSRHTLTYTSEEKLAQATRRLSPPTPEEREYEPLRKNPSDLGSVTQQ